MDMTTKITIKTQNELDMVMDTKYSDETTIVLDGDRFVIDHDVDNVTFEITGNSVVDVMYRMENPVYTLSTEVRDIRWIGASRVRKSGKDIEVFCVYVDAIPLI